MPEEIIIKAEVTPEETPTGESSERVLGALENEVEHQAEDIEELEEKVEELEEKLEWNSEEKTQIWDTLSRIQILAEAIPQLAERLEVLETLEVLEIEEEEDLAKAEQSPEIVVNDLPTTETTEQPLKNPKMETTKPNLLKRILFG